MSSTVRFNQPTLIISNIRLDIDSQIIADFVHSCGIIPKECRRGLSKDQRHQNMFIEYHSFEDAKNAKSILNNQMVPVGGNEQFKCEMRFVKQFNEVCLFVSRIPGWMSTDNIELMFAGYSSLIGSIMHRDEFGFKSAFVRFYNPIECYEALELNGRKIDGIPISVVLTAKDEQAVLDYINKTRYMDGVVTEHRQAVDMDHYNKISMQLSNDWFMDVESSRWSPLTFESKTNDYDYSHQMTVESFSRME